MGGVGALATVPILGTTAVAAHEKQYPLILGVRRQQTECDGQCDVTGRASLTVSRIAPVHKVRQEMWCFARLPRVAAYYSELSWVSPDQGNKAQTLVGYSHGTGVSTGVPVTPVTGLIRLVTPKVVESAWKRERAASPPTLQ